MNMTQRQSFNSHISNNRKLGWWDKHRLLKRGSIGEEVGRLQRQLINQLGGSASAIEVNNIFDIRTFDAVKIFQRLNGLKQDGIVGPFTYAVLFESNYKFMINKPHIVRQKSFTCWAASFESALPSWRGRSALKVNDLISRYQSHLLKNDAITTRGLRVLARDLRATGWTGKGEDFKVELVKELILKTKSPIVMDTNSMGNPWNHMVVVYGFGVKKGSPFLTIMDPLTGSYKEKLLDDIQSLSNEIILIFPR